MNNWCEIYLSPIMWTFNLEGDLEGTVVENITLEQRIEWLARFKDRCVWRSGNNNHMSRNAGLPPGNDKIHGTLSNLENFDP